MSLDYPFYEKLCIRRHQAAWWWLIGDRLYYLGLLPAMLAVPGSVLALFAGLFGYGWGRLMACSIVFVGGSVVFVIGLLLKQHSYEMAGRDGISSDEPVESP